MQDLGRPYLIITHSLNKYLRKRLIQSCVTGFLCGAVSRVLERLGCREAMGEGKKLSTVRRVK